MRDPSHDFTFDCFLPTKVIFGAGSRRRLGKLLENEGWRRVGIVVDHNVFALPAVSEVLDGIQTTCGDVIVKQCRIQEPTYDSLEEMRPAFSGNHLDAVVGIGGGSALDTAKAMAVLATNPGPSISYKGFNRMTEPVLPIVAVPTTAGTGSEATPNASFIDATEKFKMGINGEAVRPRYALLDPELTLSCPRGPTLSAGVDSVVHATEAFVAKKTNPIARFFAREGFRLVLDHLPRVLKEPQHLLSRSLVMYGAFLSGIALMHSGTGPAAALSYPLGVHYGVPHGIGGAIFLPRVVEYNVDNGFLDYGLLIDWIDVPVPVDSEARARQFLEILSSTWQSIGVPDALSQVHDSISKDLMVEDTLKLNMALEQNPVRIGREELERILSSLGVN